MAHLGRDAYALLLHLSERGKQPAVVDGNRATIDGAEFRTGIIDAVVGNGFVTRSPGDDGNDELELSAAGRADLETALAQKWVVDHSGAHDESRTYRFEVSDPVTGHRFIVAVSQDTDATLAHRVAYSVIGALSVRERCRKIEAIGDAGGFTVQVALEGAGDVRIWRKL